MVSLWMSPEIDALTSIGESLIAAVMDPSDVPSLSSAKMSKVSDVGRPPTVSVTEVALSGVVPDLKQKADYCKPAVATS